MKKCGCKNCNNLIEDYYRFCFTHKDTPYIDICKIHGRQTFINYQCQECKKLKRGIFRIYKRNRQYFHNRDKKPLPKDYFMKPLYQRLINRDRKYQEKYIGNITNGPGVYGIFLRDRTKKNQLGRCLYVGQSVDVKRRVKEHKENIKIASRQVAGVRAKAKKSDKNKSWKKLIPRDKLKTEKKYYEIAEYYMKDLVFKELFKIDKKFWSKLDKEEAKTCLSYCEQLMMDTYKPKTNLFTARNSIF